MLPNPSHCNQSALSGDLGKCLPPKMTRRLGVTRVSKETRRLGVKRLSKETRQRRRSTRKKRLLSSRKQRDQSVDHEKRLLSSLLASRLDDRRKWRVRRKLSSRSDPLGDLERVTYEIPRRLSVGRRSACRVVLQGMLEAVTALHRNDPLDDREDQERRKSESLGQKGTSSVRCSKDSIIIDD